MPTFPAFSCVGQRLPGSCGWCGGDVVAGYTVVPGAPGQLVCLCCAWFDDAERQGWLVDSSAGPW